jgi:hypothetical protein
VDRQHSEQIDGVRSEEPKLDWTRPEVDRFFAGSAEVGGGTSTDGSAAPS